MLIIQKFSLILCRTVYRDSVFMMYVFKISISNTKKNNSNNNNNYKIIITKE